jgi:hypothetical protein
VLSGEGMVLSGEDGCAKVKFRCSGSVQSAGFVWGEAEGRMAKAGRVAR